MAGLAKQIVTLPLDKGLDTKLDPKQEEIGYLRKAENLVYETIKLLRKRNGYDELDLKLVDGEVIDEPLVLGKYKTELLAMTKDRLYSRSATRQRWTEKGPLYATHSSARAVIKNANQQTQADSIAVAGFGVFAWKDSSGGVRYSVQDLADSSFLVSDVLVSATGERPVLAHIQNYVYIIYGEAGNVRFRKFSILDPSDLRAAVTAASNRHLSSGLIDAASSSTKVVVAYNADDGGNDVSVFTIDQDDDVSSVVGATSQSASVALDVCFDASERILVTYSNGSYIRVIIYPFTLDAALLAATTLETIADVKTCCSIPTDSTYRTYYEVAGSGVADNYVKQANWTFAGVVTSPTVFMRSVGLGGRAFEQDDNIFIPTVHESEVQSSYFLFDEDGYLVTKFANQVAAGTIAHGVLSACTELEDGRRMVPLVIRSRLQSEAGTFYGTDGLGISILNFEPQHKYSNALLADGLHICAGVLRFYDGATVTEHGFHVFPEVLTQAYKAVTASVATTVPGVLATTSEVQVITWSAIPDAGTYTITIDGETTAAISATANDAAIKAAIELLPSITTVTVSGAGTIAITVTFDNPQDDIELMVIGSNSLTVSLTGGSLPDGDYAYLACYRWTDNNGKDHRSSPTLTPLTVTLAGGGSTQQISVRVPTLRITDKSNVVLELYRTEDAGTTYYKVTNDLSPVFNDKTVDYVDIQDTIADATLISRELLYTTGGVLENIAAPACYQVAAYGNSRLAVVGEDSSRIFFSKEMGEGRPIEFTDAIYRDIDPVGGPVTAIRGMAEKLIVGTKGALYYISGAGPNNLGEQDTMNDAEEITTDTGITSPDSVVITATGMFFKSLKGIWRLDGGLGLSYLGARAEEFNDALVTSAEVVGSLNQIRFTLSEDRALVYNYNLDKWATFENHGARSAIVIENEYYYLREDGALYKENLTSFSDAGSPIKMRIETGWLSLAEVQGFQRAYHVLLLGQFKSLHKLRVKIAYDFKDAWVHEVLIDPTDFIDPTTYGEDTPYGSSEVYGGDGNLYQARVNLKRQKCQSIKLLIEDSQAVVGEGLTLSAVTVRAGVKEGGNKVPTANKYGTE